MLLRDPLVGEPLAAHLDHEHVHAVGIRHLGRLSNRAKKGMLPLTALGHGSLGLAYWLVRDGSGSREPACLDQGRPAGAGPRSLRLLVEAPVRCSPRRTTVLVEVQPRFASSNHY